MTEAPKAKMFLFYARQWMVVEYTKIEALYTRMDWAVGREEELSPKPENDNYHIVCILKSHYCEGIFISEMLMYCIPTMCHALTR